MSYLQANSNGHLHDAEAPTISPLDRGYLYGDSVYEVWRTFGDHVFSFYEHWERLERSAGAIGLSLPVDRVRCLTEIGRTVAAYRAETGWSGACYIRLQVSRGTGPLGLDPVLSDRARWTLFVRGLDQLDRTVLVRGRSLSVARRFRRNARITVDPASKTGNYMNNLLCLREVRARGAADAVILNQSGEVTEAPTSNLFFVNNRRIYTPPLSSGVLGGVTRQIILYRLPRPEGVSVIERLITESQLGDFNECFLASTTRDIVPVSTIDQHRYNVGPGTVTMKFKTAFASYMEANPGVGFEG
ncbi:MAG: aminotransferase class IV [Verrucomicrobia bacterium]|nr:MAG: aminotransferase class IV [Verrucomicrobiota bacterium]